MSYVHRHLDSISHSLLLLPCPHLFTVPCNWQALWVNVWVCLRYVCVQKKIHVWVYCVCRYVKVRGQIWAFPEITASLYLFWEPATFPWTHLDYLWPASPREASLQLHSPEIIEAVTAPSFADRGMNLGPQACMASTWLIWAITQHPLATFHPLGTLKYSGLKWPPLILVTVLTWAQLSSFIAPDQVQTRLLWLRVLAVDWVITEVRVTCFLSFSHPEQGCSRDGRKIPSGRAMSALVGKLFVQVRFHPVGQTQGHGQCQGQGGDREQNCLRMPMLQAGSIGWCFWNLTTEVHTGLWSWPRKVYQACFYHTQWLFHFPLPGTFFFHVFVPNSSVFWNASSLLCENI